jgi:hypothetical protein
MVPQLKSLVITGVFRSTVFRKHRAVNALDALRNTPLILPQLEELDARFKFSRSERTRMFRVIRGIVRVRRGTLNKICVSRKFGTEVIGFLKDNVPCVVVS